MQGKISITGVVTGSALLGKAEIPWVAQTSALSLAKAKPSVSGPLGNAGKQLQILGSVNIWPVLRQ